MQLDAMPCPSLMSRWPDSFVRPFPLRVSLFREVLEVRLPNPHLAVPVPIITFLCVVDCRLLTKIRESPSMFPIPVTQVCADPDHRPQVCTTRLIAARGQTGTDDDLRAGTMRHGCKRETFRSMQFHERHQPALRGALVRLL